jgi:hypothetical protein
VVHSARSADHTALPTRHRQVTFVDMAFGTEHGLERPS